MTSVLTGAERLLAWFDSRARDLPWRRSKDPYFVLVSEIMLQQTQVERVIPYFERFIEAFPTVERLAEASTEDVLTLWSGLGYYRRARLLHAAARQIVADGSFPEDIGGWIELPGIGSYTAAAIASIAFGIKAVAVDGNVERVVSRFAAIDEDLKRARGRKLLLESAEALLDPHRPGDSNQALMELGATVCRPRRPGCADCPLALECVAFATDSIASFPRPRARRQTIQELRLGVVVERSGKILLFKRPEGARLLAGLWEVPWIPWSEPGDAASRLARRYGGRWELDGDLGWIRHSITHRDIRMEVWRGRYSSGDEVAEPAVDGGWFSREDMKSLALPSLVAKIVDRAT